jgi:hypothetical protein
MRATLDIDADILRAAKAIAETESKTLGQVLSELVRRGLTEVAAAPGLTGDACLRIERESGSRPATEGDQADVDRRG